MRIERAIIQAVNVRDYSVDVFTEDTSKPLIGVPIMTPLSHPEHMGGINFLPEVGSTCYVCFPDADTYFVMGFVVSGGLVDPQVSPGPTYIGGRDPLEPGDVCLATVDGNQVVVRRGGIVQIGSNGLCQRLYVPGQNVIRDYFQRYHAISPLGEIDWGHAQIVSGDDLTNGTTPVMVRYNIKRRIQEDVKEAPYTFEVRFGILNSTTIDSTKLDKAHLFANPDLKTKGGTGLSSDTEGTLSFTIYDHTAKNKVVYAMQLSKDGDVFMISDGHVHMEFAKTLYVYAGEHITLETASGSNVRIRVGTNDEIKLGSDDASNPAVLGNELKAMLGSLLNYIVAHTHAAPGTSVPLNIAAFEALRANYLTPGAVLIHSDTVKIRN